MSDFESATDGIASPATGGGSRRVKFSLSDSDISYDNPFLDMTSTYLPTSIKKMFRIIATYLFGDSLISTIIIKLSEYPITKLIYEGWDTSIKTTHPPEKIWKDILEKHIDVRKQLIISGANYYGYGNSYISVHFPFQRKIKCLKCDSEIPVGNMRKIKYVKNRYNGKCIRCGYEGDFTFFDRLVKDFKKIRIIHWDIANIDVKFNNITGESFYYYTIPSNIKSAVAKGDLDIINTTPKDVLEAIKQSKRLKLNQNNLFHLKREHVSYLYPSERGYGIPAVLPVIKSIFHNQILKKGNEMIAFEYIVPLRVLFPMQQGEISPHVNMDMRLWKQKVDDAIKEWRKDKNKIMTVPQPVGVVKLGGEARALMVTQEIKLTEDDIIVGMGMIPEIIRGGASWSGSNVSLRVIENSFLNHRSDMKRVLDFVINQISTKYDIPEIEVRFSDFKMADDLQKKQLLMSAGSGPPGENYISKETVIRELGFDPEEEYQNKQNEIKRLLDIRIQDAKGNAKAQGEASIINAIFGAEANIEHQNRMEIGERKSYEKRMRADEERMHQNAEQVHHEVDDIAHQTGVDENSVSIPDLIMRLTERFAVLSRVNVDEFKVRMLNMKMSAPALYEEIYNNLREMNLIEADLKPDLQLAQDKTPGEIPQYVQGDANAQDPPTPVKQPTSVGIAGSRVGKGLPEAGPPRSQNSPI